MYVFYSYFCLYTVLAMDSKLTINLDEDVIARAKKYASVKNLSLSQLIENYLDSLTLQQSDDFEISPFVKSISSGNSVELDADWKELRDDYVEYLDKKHQ